MSGQKFTQSLLRMLTAHAIVLASKLNTDGTDLVGFSYADHNFHK